MIEDDATLERCVEALRHSDERLRNRPQERMLWDWQLTTIDTELNSDAPGGTISLGAAWYDEEFFDEKKDAYTDPLHLAAYLDIGLESGSISVTHWRYEGGGTH
ncbi:MAG: hypothetical protein GY926_14420 [bacterium]|nr:hypothetical protein [bacterium]